MFKFINDRFKALSLPVALVVLTFVCFTFALVASTAVFTLLNGTLPPNLIAVVGISSIIASVPMILQSMPTIKYLQNSRERLKSTSDELEARVAELDAAYGKLNDARAELEARVEQRTHEVNEARREAEGANRAKSDFLAKMSHELRTPLNAVIGFSELLIHPDALPKEKKLEIIEDYAGTIHQSGKHLLSLVNDLLDLSKIEAGQIELYPEAIELAPFIEDIHDLMIGQAQERDQKLTVAIEANTGCIKLDRRALKQILLNLLSNSIKYSQHGSSISLSLTRQEDNILFTVADEGYGMSSEDVSRALQPFSRLANAEMAGADGTGLGLPIVVSMVEAMGGTMGIDSVVDEGTTVTVTFPAIAIAMADHKQSEASAVA